MPYGSSRHFSFNIDVQVIVIPLMLIACWILVPQSKCHQSNAICNWMYLATPLVMD